MASPAPARAGGRKILGLKPRTALIAGGGILAAALIYFWWRNKNAKSPAATSASASASAYSDAAQLDALQAEFDQLLMDQNPGSAGGGSSTGSSTGTGTGTTGTGTGTSPGKTTSPGPVATKTPPPPTGGTATAKPKPAVPAGVHDTKVTPTSVTLAWAKDPNATTYRIRVTYQGKLVGGAHTVTGTSATISGLTPDHTYTFHVAAIGPGGVSAETNGPAVKTSR